MKPEGCLRREDLDIFRRRSDLVQDEKDQKVKEQQCKEYDQSCPVVIGTLKLNLLTFANRSALVNASPPQHPQRSLLPRRQLPQTIVRDPPRRQLPQTGVNASLSQHPQQSLLPRRQLPQTVVRDLNKVHTFQAPSQHQHQPAFQTNQVAGQHNPAINNYRKQPSPTRGQIPHTWPPMANYYTPMINSPLVSPNLPEDTSSAPPTTTGSARLPTENCNTVTSEGIRREQMATNGLSEVTPLKISSDSNKSAISSLQNEVRPKVISTPKSSSTDLSKSISKNKGQESCKTVSIVSKANTHHSGLKDSDETARTDKSCTRQRRVTSENSKSIYFEKLKREREAKNLKKRSTVSVLEISHSTVLSNTKEVETHELEETHLSRKNENHKKRSIDCEPESEQINAPSVSPNPASPEDSFQCLKKTRVSLVNSSNIHHAKLDCNRKRKSTDSAPETTSKTDCEKSESARRISTDSNKSSKHDPGNESDEFSMPAASTKSKNLTEEISENVDVPTKCNKRKRNQTIGAIEKKAKRNIREIIKIQHPREVNMRRDINNHSSQLKAEHSKNHVYSAAIPSTSSEPQTSEAAALKSTKTSNSSTNSHHSSEIKKKNLAKHSKNDTHLAAIITPSTDIEPQMSEAAAVKKPSSSKNDGKIKKKNSSEHSKNYAHSAATITASTDIEPQASEAAAVKTDKKPNSSKKDGKIKKKNSPEHSKNDAHSAAIPTTDIKQHTSEAAALKTDKVSNNSSKNEHQVSEIKKKNSNNDSSHTKKEKDSKKNKREQDSRHHKKKLSSPNTQKSMNVEKLFSPDKPKSQSPSKNSPRRNSSSKSTTKEENNCDKLKSCKRKEKIKSSKHEENSKKHTSCHQLVEPSNKELKDSEGHQEHTDISNDQGPAVFTDEEALNEDPIYKKTAMSLAAILTNSSDEIQVPPAKSLPTTDATVEMNESLTEETCSLPDNNKPIQEVISENTENEVANSAEATEVLTDITGADCESVKSNEKESCDYSEKAEHCLTRILSSSANITFVDLVDSDEDIDMNVGVVDQVENDVKESDSSENIYLHYSSDSQSTVISPNEFSPTHTNKETDKEASNIESSRPPSVEKNPIVSGSVEEKSSNEISFTDLLKTNTIKFSHTVTAPEVNEESVQCLAASTEPKNIEVLPNDVEPNPSSVVSTATEVPIAPVECNDSTQNVTEEIGEENLATPNTTLPLDSHIVTAPEVNEESVPCIAASTEPKNIEVLPNDVEPNPSSVVSTATEVPIAPVECNDSTQNVTEEIGEENLATPNTTLPLDSYTVTAPEVNEESVPCIAASTEPKNIEVLPNDVEPNPSSVVSTATEVPIAPVECNDSTQNVTEEIGEENLATPNTTLPLDSYTVTAPEVNEESVPCIAASTEPKNIEVLPNDVEPNPSSVVSTATEVPIVPVEFNDSTQNVTQEIGEENLTTPNTTLPIDASASQAENSSVSVNVESSPKSLEEVHADPLNMYIPDGAALYNQLEQNEQMIKLAKDFVALIDSVRDGKCTNDDCAPKATKIAVLMVHILKLWIKNGNKDSQIQFVLDEYFEKLQPKMFEPCCYTKYAFLLYKYRKVHMRQLKAATNTSVSQCSKELSSSINTLQNSQNGSIFSPTLHESQVVILNNAAQSHLDQNISSSAQVMDLSTTSLSSVVQKNPATAFNNTRLLSAHGRSAQNFLSAAQEDNSLTSMSKTTPIVQDNVSVSNTRHTTPHLHPAQSFPLAPVAENRPTSSRSQTTSAPLENQTLAYNNLSSIAAQLNHAPSCPSATQVSGMTTGPMGTSGSHFQHNQPAFYLYQLALQRAHLINEQQQQANLNPQQHQAHSVNPELLHGNQHYSASAMASYQQQLMQADRLRHEQLASVNTSPSHQSVAQAHGIHNLTPLHQMEQMMKSTANPIPNQNCGSYEHVQQSYRKSSAHLPSNRRPRKTQSNANMPQVSPNHNLNALQYSSETRRFQPPDSAENVIAGNPFETPLSNSKTPTSSHSFPSGPIYTQNLISYEAYTKQQQELYLQHQLAMQQISNTTLPAQRHIPSVHHTSMNPVYAQNQYYMPAGHQQQSTQPVVHSSVNIQGQSMNAPQTTTSNTTSAWDGSLMERPNVLATPDNYATPIQHRIQNAMNPDIARQHVPLQNWASFQNNNQVSENQEVEQKIVKEPCFTCKKMCDQQCSVCHLIFYCSVKCQELDWVNHQKVCISRETTEV